MRFKKFKNTVIGILLTSGLLLLWGFAAKESRLHMCIGHNITINSRSANYFINNKTVERIITEQFDTLKGRMINRQTLIELHTLLEKNAFVDNVAVYRTMNNKIGINICLRDPIIRVINNNNESFYIDENGYMFPLSEHYTARVMLATGNIPAGPTKGRIAMRSQAAASEGINNSIDTMTDLFALASYIHSNLFWRAFIDHIYVHSDGKFELIPKNGAHAIEFGRAEDISKKFRKLELFYLKVLPEMSWHYYRRINLEFRNQIICSK